MKSPSLTSDSPQPLLAVEGEKKEADELALPYPYCFSNVRNHVKKSASASSSEADAFFKKSEAVKTDDWTNVYKRAAFAASPASYSEEGNAYKHDFTKSIKTEEGDAAFLIDGKGMETLNSTDFQKSDGKGKQAMESPKKENGGDEEEIKVWNLRPRVVKSKTTNNANTGKTTKSKGVKKEKLSVAISLTKEEIEEDIFAFTGAKPSRRPKKRPKNVQKQLDSISADSYKVSENSLKG